MKTRLARSGLALAALAALLMGCGDEETVRPAGSAGTSSAGSGGAGAGGSGAAGASGTGASAGNGAGGSEAQGPFDYASLCAAYCDAAAAFQANASAWPDAGVVDAGVPDASASDDDSYDGTGEGSGEGADGPAEDDEVTNHACATTNPDCVQSCVNTGTTYDDACRGELQAMFQCFSTNVIWFCDGTPSYPNPAGCATQQSAFGLCARPER